MKVYQFTPSVRAAWRGVLDLAASKHQKIETTAKDHQVTDQGKKSEIGGCEYEYGAE